MKNIDVKVTDQEIKIRLEKFLKKYNSPMIAEDFFYVSQQTGIGVDALVAQALYESSFATKGKGKNTNNPLNWGNDDAGNTKSYPTMRAGLLAAAQGLKRVFKFTTPEDFIARGFMGIYGTYAPVKLYSVSYPKYVKIARDALGGKSVLPEVSNNALGNAVASGLSNLSSVLSGIFSRANCTPPPFMQSDFITYTGCGQVVASAGSLAGMGFGSAAPGIGALATGSSPNVNGISGEILNSPKLGAFGWPLEKAFRASSEFGFRTHPISGKRKMHNGVDFGAPTGTKIIAIADGKVAQIQSIAQSGGYGNRVVTSHAGGVQATYNHLSLVQCQVGQEIKQGQVLGEVGTTGRSTGPHLHFEIIDNGYKNPRSYIPFPKA